MEKKQINVAIARAMRDPELPEPFDYVGGITQQARFIVWADAFILMAGSQDEFEEFYRNMPLAEDQRDLIKRFSFLRLWTLL